MGLLGGPTWRVNKHSNGQETSLVNAGHHANKICGTIPGSCAPTIYIYIERFSARDSAGSGPPSSFNLSGSQLWTPAGSRRLSGNLVLWQHWAGCQHLCSLSCSFSTDFLVDIDFCGHWCFTIPTTLTWRLTLSRPSSSCLGLCIAPAELVLALAVCLDISIYGFLPLVAFLGSIHWTSSRTPSDAISGDREQGRDWLGSYTNVVCAFWIRNRSQLYIIDFADIILETITF